MLELTGRNHMHVIAAKLGRYGELLPHDPVLALAVHSQCRRMMYYL